MQVTCQPGNALQHVEVHADAADGAVSIHADATSQGGSVLLHAKLPFFMLHRYPKGAGFCEVFTRVYGVLHLANTHNLNVHYASQTMLH